MIKLDGKTYEGSPLTDRSGTRLISIMGGVSSVAAFCGDQSGSSYIYRVLCDGVLLATLATTAPHLRYDIRQAGTYQVGVSIDGAPEILSATLAMGLLTKPRTDIRY